MGPTSKGRGKRKGKGEREEEGKGKEGREGVLALPCLALWWDGISRVDVSAPTLRPNPCRSNAPVP